MQLRAVLTLAAALFLVGDAQAQVTTNPTGPGGDFCAVRNLPYGPSAVTGGELGCYRLNGAAGDKASFTLGAVAGSQPVVRVATPDGWTFCTGAAPTCPLPTDGTYTVTVTGRHTLSVQRLGDPVGCSALAVASPPAVAVPAAGAVPCFRVSGAPGMRLRVRVVPLSGGVNPRVEVVRPDGLPRCAPTTADDSTCLLGASGLHTLLVRDAGTGSFAIEVRRLDTPANCRAIAFSTTAVTDALTGGASDCFRFDAAAGDRVRTRVRADGPSPGLRPTREVLRPDGTTLCTAVAIEEQTCTTDTPGTHMILVRDSSPGTGGGRYQVAVQRLNNPVGCTPAWLGTDATRAELAIGQTHCLRLVGYAGERLSLRAIAGSTSQDIVVDVVRPDGTTRCWDTSNDDCVLDATGAHTVLIRDTSWGATGTYWWAFQSLTGPVGCTILVKDAAPSIGPLALGAAPCWRFRGNADEHIQIDLNKLSGDFDIQLELMRPNGHFSYGSNSPYTSDTIYTQLYDTGWHTLYVRDGSTTGLGTGTYELALSD